MSKSLNEVNIIGHVGQDPAYKKLDSGTSVCNFSIATTEMYKDKQGALKEKTEWHRISCFNKIADVIGEFVKKGSRLYVKGKLSNKKWVDSQTNQEKITTEIIVNELIFLDSKKEQEKKQVVQPSNDYSQYDDIPF